MTVEMIFLLWSAAALVVATELTSRSDSLTQWGAQLWFWAPGISAGYFIDILPIRSPIWSVSLLGLVLLFLGATS